MVSVQSLASWERPHATGTAPPSPTDADFFWHLHTSDTVEHKGRLDTVRVCVCVCVCVCAQTLGREGEESGGEHEAVLPLWSQGSWLWSLGPLRLLLL